MEFLKHKYTKSQKILIVWFPLFTGICFLNILALYLKVYGHVSIVILLPFIHLLMVTIISIIRLICWRLKIYKDPNYEYIKNSYPDIWIRIFSAGDNRTGNNFAAFSFLRGKYDDGSDNKLNQVKTNIRLNILFVLWAWAIMLMVLFACIIISV
jgi:hypothetical protein